MRKTAICLSVVLLPFAALPAFAGPLEELKAGAAPEAAAIEIARPAAPEKADKYLPGEGEKVLEKRGYAWYPDAHSVLVKLLPGMRAYPGITVLSVPDEGVFDYVSSNDNGTYYGFRIFYKGPTVDTGKHEGPAAMSAFEGTKKVLDKMGAKILWSKPPVEDEEGFSVSYLRDVSRPDFETQYSGQLANAAAVKAWVNSTVAELNKEGALIAYTTAYETRGSVVYARAK